MTTHTGYLRYLGWRAPWTLHEDANDACTTGASGADVRGSVIAVLLALHEGHASMEESRTEFVLRHDLDSEFVLKYPSDERDPKDGAYWNPVLTKPEDFGFRNLGLYLGRALERLNGQRVEIVASATDGTLRIASVDHDQPAVKYHRQGNFGRIPGTVEETCGPGTARCCAFLVAGSGGFECAKFSELGSQLLERVATNTINARRIGGCRIDGRV